MVPKIANEAVRKGLSLSDKAARERAIGVFEEFLLVHLDQDARKLPYDLARFSRLVSGVVEARAGLTPRMYHYFRAFSAEIFAHAAASESPPLDWRFFCDAMRKILSSLRPPWDDEDFLKSHPLPSGDGRDAAASEAAAE